MDWSKPFLVKNISDGRVVNGAFAIGHKESREVNPILFSPKAIDKFKLYVSLGIVEATNDFKSANGLAVEGKSVTNELTTVRNEAGETREHTVFDPFKQARAIVVENIEMGKPLVVENLQDNGKVIEVKTVYGDNDIEDARDFLIQHWKRVESEVGKINSKDRLEFLLKVATDYSIAEKKIEIIKNRINEL